MALRRGRGGGATITLRSTPKPCIRLSIGRPLPRWHLLLHHGAQRFRRRPCATLCVAARRSTAHGSAFAGNISFWRSAKEKLHTEGDFDFYHFSCNLDGCGCSGSFSLADRTIQESVAQGFEIVALGAFPASISSTGSQLVVRQRASLLTLPRRSLPSPFPLDLLREETYNLLKNVGTHQPGVKSPARLGALEGASTSRSRDV